MSKSYKNTIPLFESSEELLKLIMKIKTDSAPPDEPKNPDDSTLFMLYSEFAGQEQILKMRERECGIGWGEAKKNCIGLSIHIWRSRESKSSSRSITRDSQA